MAYFLCIDTSTDICSVLISRENHILCHLKVSDKNVHSSLLTSFIENCLKQANLSLTEINAIGINAGPGSFTGLRIGIAVAKGVCYGSSIPLIGINSLEALAKAHAHKSIEDLYICPMMESKNKEVYFCLFDQNMNLVYDYTCSKFDDELILSSLDKKKVVFTGNAVDSWTLQYQNHPNAVYSSIRESDATLLSGLTTHKYNMKIFEDIRYFEPYYLREFKAQKSSKRMNQVLHGPQN